MKDLHDQCLDESKCLCAEYNHGVKEDSFRDGVLVSKYMNTPIHEPRLYEQSLELADQLDDLKEFGRRKNSELWAIRKFIELTILSSHLVSINDIETEVISWMKTFDMQKTVDKKTVDEIITDVISDKDIFLLMKQICFELGKSGKDILFERGQLTEIAWYLMGKYHIKRIDLTGDLLFYNGQYYEKNAEALIRRTGRNCLLKPKKGDMNEVVAAIEDSCTVITWKDIENSIHLKCMLNGIYDLREGGFSETFTPDNIILQQIPHQYNEGIRFDKINTIVSEIISDDKDRQSFYDSLSNAFFPYTGIDFQFGGVGQPGTGKSQLCKLAEKVFGEDNVGDAPIHAIASDPTTQKEMAYKMMNIDQDMGEESIKHIEVLKKWITQDSFTARGIYQFPTTFRPMARILFMTNELYEIPSVDDSEAMYERTHLIKINNKFRGQSNVQLNIIDKAATPEELSGFVSYLLKNCHEIFLNQQIHYPMPFAVVKDTWNLFGNRIHEFIKKWLVVSPNQMCEHNEPWDKWLSYALQKGYQAKDKKKFKSTFEEIMGMSATKSRSEGEQGYYYHGFRIKTDKEMAQEEQTPLDPNQSETKTKLLIMKLLRHMLENQK
jgi:phage/plasmid-associated DNA primase